MLRTNCDLRGISDFNFAFAQDHTPAASASQSQNVMPSLGGTAARLALVLLLAETRPQPPPEVPFEEVCGGIALAGIARE